MDPSLNTSDLNYKLQKATFEYNSKPLFALYDTYVLYPNKV